MDLTVAAMENWMAVKDLIPSLRPDDWNRPTPCVGWSVKDVLAHLGHVEGMLVHQFHQPEPPADWVGEGSPLDQVTSLGVAARRTWSPSQVVDEIERAITATHRQLTQPDLDWQEPTLTPVGPAPRHVAVEMRINDVYLHLCDIRTAIGRPIDGPAVDTATQGKEVAIGRAVRLSPWAWAKRMGAHEGQRLRLSLSGIGGVDQDIVMRDGKALVESQDGAPDAVVTGTALAYLLAVSGRHALVPAGGGLVATGEPARALLEKFRLVG
jgi:uncharacterized protein (TIGR03083 family)